MSFLILGEAKSGKKSFVEKLGGVFCGVNEAVINNQFFTNKRVFICENMVRVTQDYSIVFIITHPGGNPLKVFHENKDYITCPVIVIMNKYDNMLYLYKNYQIMTTIRVNYREKVENMKKRWRHIEDELWTDYNIPICRISCFSMSFEQIYSRIADDLPFETMPAFKCAASIDI